MRTILATAILALSIGACGMSADPGPPAAPACPHLQIKAPDVVPAGTLARLSLSLVGAGEPASYVWTVTDGVIVSGQGTPIVLVDTAGMSGGSIRATVELFGLAPECVSTTASAGFLIGPPETTSRR